MAKEKLKDVSDRICGKALDDARAHLKKLFQPLFDRFASHRYLHVRMKKFDQLTYSYGHTKQCSTNSYTLQGIISRIPGVDSYVDGEIIHIVPSLDESKAFYVDPRPRGLYVREFLDGLEETVLAEERTQIEQQAVDGFIQEVNGLRGQLEDLENVVQYAGE